MFTAKVHPEIPLDMVFGIKNKGWVCKIGPVWGRYLWERAV
jgi:hypothetical protein